MKLFGPFQCVHFAEAPLSGPLKKLGLIEQAGLLVDRGVVVALGPFEELKPQAEEIIECEKRTVCLPGFVDCHTHLCYAGTRAGEYVKKLEGATYLEIARAGGGILSTVASTRQASEEELTRLTLERLLDKMKTGVTTCEIKSGYGLTIHTEIKMLRAIRAAAESAPLSVIATCLAAHVPPPEAASGAAHLELMARELLPLLFSSRLATRVDIFIEETAFNPEEAERYLLQAKKIGFDLTVHADQFSPMGARVAAKVGALSADHLEAVDEGSIQALKEANVAAVVLPGASMGLGMHYAPARTLLDAGLSVAIASDQNPGSAPMGDLPLQAFVMGMAEKLTAAETLAGITYRAAHALGLSDRGRLAVGERADFALYQADDYAEILWRQGALKPKQVYIRGELCHAL